MHARKALFTSLSDGFVTLPGGVGTMDELWEAVSWAQLGYHSKPVGLLNAGGFYDRHRARSGRRGHGGIPAGRAPYQSTGEDDRGTARPSPAHCASIVGMVRDLWAGDGSRQTKAIIHARQHREGIEELSCREPAFRQRERARATVPCRRADDIAGGQDHGHGMTTVAGILPASRRSASDLNWRWRASPLATRRTGRAVVVRMRHSERSAARRGPRFLRWTPGGSSSRAMPTIFISIAHQSPVSPRRG